MISNNPWVEIPQAHTGQFSRRRVNAETKYALFWFRDEANHPGLLIEISKVISSNTLKQARINIRDISVDVIEDEGIRSLIIKLEVDQHLDIFLKLCLDLIERVATGTDKEDIFHTICRRLKKWQSLLSGKARNLLSANEVQGLYAELYFIAETLTEDASRERILINGWEGPEKTQHDFILDDKALEIKSVAGNQRAKVRISSEDQLDTHMARLYLRVYFLSEMLTDDNAESLNGIVKRIASQLTDKENKELFEMKLASAHYIDIPDYDAPFFRVKDCRTYLVSNDFPRIIRKALPEGVEDVSYDLVLATIEKFRTTTLSFIGE